MKFYFEGEFNEEPRKEGKLAKTAIRPSTNSRSCREIFVLVANEVLKPQSGQEFNFGLVGKAQTPMIFPNTKEDNRILVMGDIPQPKHRSDGYVDTEKTTGKILDESQGGGAWGAGSCFLALLKEGERVVSNRLIVWENVAGQLVKTRFESLAEYELKYTDTNIDFI